MKLFHKMLILALACVAFGLYAGTANAYKEKAQSNTNLALCKNIDYALCAASTCTPTGKRIAVNTPDGGKRYFREAVCTCPVLNSGDTGALANLGGGNMQGSCASPVATVWSLYQPASPIPQAAFGWQSSAVAVNTSCTSSLNQGRQFANCFSFKCDNIRQQAVQGGGTTTVADCHCPLGEDVFSALPTKPATGFITSAGATTSDPASYCYQHPVGGF